MGIAFEPALPVWVLAVLLVAALLAAHLAYRRGAELLLPWRRWTLRALRAATLVLLVGCLAGPVRIDPTGGRWEAAVPILIDVSRSMGLADQGGVTRLAQARDVVRERLLPPLAARFETPVLSFGEALAEAPLAALEPRARRSDLTGALAALRRREAGRPLAGIVVVSDGGLTGADPIALALDVPVFAVLVGSRDGIRDREVVSLRAGDTSLRGSSADLAATVASRGFGPAPVTVTLRENGRVLQVRSTGPVDEDTPATVVFAVSPPPDRPAVYSVEIAADPGEITLANNVQSLVVEPARRRGRVLLVEGAPGFEHSFLKRALDQDPGLEVDALVRKGQNDRGADTYYVQAAASRAEALLAGYPASREVLFAYDAVVFANVEPDVFTVPQLALTADFVAERGGGWLLLGGRAFEHQSWLRTPVEDLLPLELADRAGTVLRAAARSEAGRFRLLPTADGLAHPMLGVGATAEETRRAWAQVPPLASVAALGGPKPGASVLAEVVADAGMVRPLLAVQRYGEGRTMVFTGEAAWRWKMGRPSGDRLYDTFWRQAVRWLVTGAPEPVSVRVPDAAAPGEPFTVSVMVRDAAFAPVADAIVRVRVGGPGGEARELVARPAENSLGRYEARLVPDVTGLWRVEVDARRGRERLGWVERVALVGGADEEFADPRAHAATLRRLAEATGGEVVDPAAPGAIPALLEALAARAPARVAVRRSLWHTPWMFGLIVGAACLEWTLRRRWGWR